MRGTDRRQLITDVVAPFADELKHAIGDRQVVIKLNNNRPDRQLIKTHPDSVRAVLDVITPWYDKQVIVGESTALEVPSEETFAHLGFYDLEREYNVRIEELNEYPTYERWIYTRDMLPRKTQILQPFMDPNYFIISVAPIKTHGSAIVTLSLKNIVMGSPIKDPRRNINFKSIMHGGSSPKLINLNMFTLAQSVRPHFSVLDGFIGAEGNGPHECDPVDHKVAVAGPDVIAVDRVGVELMGVPWENIGYLQWCSLAGIGQGELDKITIIGSNPKRLSETYAMPDNYERLQEWKREIDWELIHPRS
jgi:uncharacterized protein (DUF362 family)